MQQLTFLPLDPTATLFIVSQHGKETLVHANEVLKRGDLLDIVGVTAQASDGASMTSTLPPPSPAALPFPLASAASPGAEPLQVAIGRMRHSCSPTVSVTHDRARQAIVAFVIAPQLSPGDELTIAKTDVWDTRRYRRRRLRERGVGFDYCACPACSLDDAEAIAQSDSCRLRIREIYSTLAREREMLSCVALVEEALACLEDEHLYEHSGAFAHHGGSNRGSHFLGRCSPMLFRPQRTRRAWSRTNPTWRETGHSRPTSPTVASEALTRRWRSR